MEENPNRYTVEVPLVFWASEAFRDRYPEKWAAITSAVSRPYMTDDMIHTLLDLMDIRTAEYDAAKSVINESFDRQRKRVIQGRDYDASMR